MDMQVHSSSRVRVSRVHKKLSLSRSRRCAFVDQARCRFGCLVAPSNNIRVHAASPGPTAPHATASSSSESSKEQDGNIRRTLAGLDALLGIDEEAEKQKAAEAAAAAAQQRQQSAVEVTVDTSLLDKIADAEAERLGKLGVGVDSSEMRERLSSQMKKLVEQARKSDQSTPEAAEKELKQLTQSVRGVLENVFENTVSLEDVRIITKELCGRQLFWVTETSMMDGEDLGCVLIRGNVRTEITAALEQLSAAVESRFSGKYKVYLIADPNIDPASAEAAAGPRPAFKIVPRAMAEPQPNVAWMVVIATVLALLTFGSSLQLGLIAALPKLPKETVEWLANPNNLNTNALPPGLDDSFDAVPYLDVVIRVTFGILASNVAHDIGHRVSAAVHQVKLGPGLFIPSAEIGSFGPLTQIKSLLRNRTQLWDVASWGPFAGGLTAAALFALGLLLSMDPASKDSLTAVPSFVMTGSLLLGSITKSVLGTDGATTAPLLVHPLLIAGWMGLFITSLNLLPVGSLDGGRMMQAAFGKNALAVTSFLVYVGLGFGLLGSVVSLPFGLFVLICQRSHERFVQDQFSDVSSWRQNITVIAITLALFVLVPLDPIALTADPFSTPLL